MFRKLLYILLPTVLRRPLANFIYGLIAYRNNFVYKWRLVFRFLKNDEILKRFDEVRDWSYRRKFKRLSIVIHTSLKPKLVKKRDGILLAIGTLSAGGAERQVVMTAKGLVTRGYDNVRVVCFSLQQSPSSFYRPHLQKLGVAVSDLNEEIIEDDPELANILAKVERFIPLPISEVAGYIRKIYKAPPLIAHLWLDEVNIKVGIAAVILRVPTIILGLRNFPPNNFLFYQPYMREAYRWLVEQPGVKLVGNSHAGARAYERWLGIPDNAVDVIHNGFDYDIDYLEKCRSLAEDYRAMHGLRAACPVVGTVIRLAEEKRPFLWLEIAAQVRKQCPSAQFLLVGDGPLRSDLELRAQMDDLKGAVTFMGLEAEALKAMAAMDIFLLTSRLEGLPNVLIEAQAIGVPVVTTNVGGAPETMLDRVTGWVLDNDEIIDAANQIIRLIRDENWRDQARLSMPTFICEKFGMEKMLNKTLSIYGVQ